MLLMALGFLVLLAAFIFEDKYLGAARMLFYRRRDGGAGNEWGTNLGARAANKEDLIEGHGLTDLFIKLIDIEHLAGGDPELSRTTLNNGVHSISISVEWATGAAKIAYIVGKRSSCQPEMGPRKGDCT